LREGGKKPTRGRQVRGPRLGSTKEGVFAEKIGGGSQRKWGEEKSSNRDGSRGEKSDGTRTSKGDSGAGTNERWGPGQNWGSHQKTNPPKKVGGSYMSTPWLEGERTKPKPRAGTNVRGRENYKRENRPSKKKKEPRWQKNRKGKKAKRPSKKAARGGSKDGNQKPGGK